MKSSIQARVVAIADGAFFEGEVRMDGTGGPGTPQTFTEKRHPPQRSSSGRSRR